MQDYSYTSFMTGEHKLLFLKVGGLRKYSTPQRCLTLQGWEWTSWKLNSDHVKSIVYQPSISCSWLSKCWNNTTHCRDVILTGSRLLLKRAKPLAVLSEFIFKSLFNSLANHKIKFNTLWPQSSRRRPCVRYSAITDNRNWIYSTVHSRPYTALMLIS